MTTDFKQIHNQIEMQFPSLYRREGENLIAFIEAYYEWLDQPGNLHNQIFNFQDNLDIDTTVDAFLTHFRDTYMVGLSNTLLGNQRLLQKHILDLYGAKNSKASIELLFRLMFNKSVDVYLPSKDILRTSDGKWTRDTYMEIEYTPDFNTYINKTIEGSVSGATALVVGTEKRIINDLPRYILYVEDIKGTFSINEKLYYDEAHNYVAARILGSVVGIDIAQSFDGWSPGDVAVVTSQVFGTGIRMVVTETVESNTGSIFPSVTFGGNGYSMNAVFATSSYQNTHGSGFEVVVKSIANTFIRPVTNVLCSALVGVPLNSTYTTLPMPTSNHSTVIATAMAYTNVEFGTIKELLVRNPGSDYDGAINIQATEPRLAPLGLSDGNGGILGADAVIDNYAGFGNKMLSTVVVKSSGFGYNGTFRVDITNEANNLQFAAANLIYGPIGFTDGRYITDDGFLSSTKKLQDGYYYQQFSYEIRASESIERYAEVVRKIAHPSGNEMFGSTLVRDYANKKLLGDSSVTIS